MVYQVIIIDEKHVRLGYAKFFEYQMIVVNI